MASQVDEPDGTDPTLVALLAWGVRTASGAGSVVLLEAEFGYLATGLVVTAASAAAGDTLDVYIQQTFDSVNYDDLVHFAQVLGNGGAKMFLSSSAVRRADLAAETHEATDAALAAGTARDVMAGRSFKVKWVIAGATPSFSFQVLGFPRAGR
jgi:hypothetical protein